jgi:hypothetical protein
VTKVRKAAPKQFVKLGANAYFERMAKWLGILAIVLVGVIAGLFLAADIPLETNIDAGVPLENIVTDAIARRVTAQGVEVDVSDIVKKYIAAGEDRKAVVRYLTALRFKLRFQLMEVDGVEALIATRSPLERTLGNYSPIPFPYFDKLEVVVYFDGQLVRSASGQLIYRAS